MDPVIGYLGDRKFSYYKQEPRSVKLSSARYVILGDVLYKKGYALPYKMLST